MDISFAEIHEKLDFDLREKQNVLDGMEEKKHQIDDSSIVIAELRGQIKYLKYMQSWFEDEFNQRSFEFTQEMNKGENE